MNIFKINILKRIIAGTIVLGLVNFNALPFVIASEISGVTPKGNIYNIEAEKVSGSTGFRYYDKFNLTQGDIANLIYKNNYSKFVNLINSQININGIVNTMKGGNFYNGHAIFVSPLGMVIGASGVLNVGSLSVLTPSQSNFDSFLGKYNSGDLAEYVYGANKYNALISDSHGNILINGRILAREDVNLYGDNITIQGTSDNKAGIIAGVQNNDNYETFDAAKLAFDSLVSNNIKSTNKFSLENGKIKIVAGFKDYTGSGDDRKPEGASDKAEVTIDNAQIGGGNIEIKANSTKKDSYILADPDEAISSKIDVTNSDITGSNINILANSESSLSRNINLTVPTVLLWIFDSDSHMDEFFSDEVYTGFEGVRTAATVNITNSILNSIGDLSISAKSSSDTNVGSQAIGPIEVSQFIPAIFYGYGTKTESKINIKESTLNANGNVDLNAISNNVLKAKIADEVMAGITLKTTDAFNLALMKNSAQADTKIVIDKSTVKGRNISAQAIAYNEIDNTVILKPRIGRNDLANDTQMDGGSSISLGGIINATDIRSAVEVKNGSVINAVEDVTLNAYNINDVSNWVDSEITDPLDYAKTWQQPETWLSKQFDRLGRVATAYDQATTFTISDFVNKFTNKAENLYNTKHPDWKLAYSKANFESGAGVLWNDANTNNSVIVSNSKITAGNDINIKAHTVDLTANEVDAYAEEDASWGGALSLLVNKQKNTNKVDIIDSSELNAKNNINVDSIVELPAQQGTFGISNKYLTLGMNFGFSANEDWNFGFHDVTSNNSSDKILPEAGIFGFYNNFAAASSAGDKASISAAVIYSDLENHSDINITNSILTADTGDIIANSVISASAHDAVDFINYDGLIDEIKSLAKSIKGDEDGTNKWNHASGSGAGGSVLVQDFTNNARITVNESKLKAENGDIELNTAAEQSYLNLITPGGKAETIGITGAVSVQGIHGTTSSTVKNNSNLIANNISINSGKAKAAFTKKGSDMAKTGLEFLNNDDEVELAEERNVNDHITAVAINGSLTKQSEEGQGTTSSGAALGASVMAQSIDRIIKTSVEGSVLTANKIDAKAESYTRDIFITAAGAFAGGVSPDKSKQKQANDNANNNQADNNPQEAQNYGNWMDILDNAQPDDEDVLGLNRLFNDNNPNAEGAQNAAGQAGEANQLAGGVANPQNAVGNFSLALAGSVSVVNDNSVVATEIINSTLNTGEELNATADRENFMLNVTGGIAKSGSVGGGAAVNVYSDKGGAISKIDDSTIFFTKNNAKALNVTANNDHTIIETAVGVGIASNDESGSKVAVGGSFSTNVLKDETKSIINNTTVKNAEDVTGDIDVTLNSSADTTAWNIGGDLGFAKGENATFALGAGVAGNLNLLKQTVVSEITKSQGLSDLKNITVNSDLVQNINSIAIAGAAVNGAQSSFTIDGALGIDLIENTVTAQLKDNKKISSSGDIKVDAKSKLNGRDLTGSADISNANNSLGVGIGSVIEVDNSKINATIDNSKILNSKSIEVKADSSDDRKFLAVNLGVQTGSGITVAINANGIVSVLKSTINAAVINGSELSSDGVITISSIYDNKNQGITILGDVAKKGGAIGANIIANHYGNEITSELSKDSKIIKSGNIGIGAKSSEYINMIPIAVALSTGGVGSVAADVAVNIIKDSTIAKAEGNLETTGNLTVAADSETTIYNRGGTLAIASADAAVAMGGSINVDYIGKTVKAYIGNETVKNTVNADGNIYVSALSTNSLGGTKNSSDKYDRDDITSDSYQDNLMKKDSEGNYSGINYDNDFGNWNMLYNLSAGANVAISGAVVVKTIDNTVTAEILNSDLTSNNMDLMAKDYSIKNIIAGQISASGTAALGAQVIYLNDKSNTSSLISNGSDIDVTNTLNISAVNQKDDNQIVVAASAASDAAGIINGLINNISDNNTAKIDASTVRAGQLNITSDEDMNSSKILVAAAGSSTFAINIAPVNNKYFGTTISEITNSTINNAAIAMQSDTNIKTRDIGVGVAGAGEGFAGTGLIIKNIYDTTTKSTINSTTINGSSEKDIILNSNSVINSGNWIVGVSGVGVGASFVANVILNNIISDVEASINDSIISNAGNIELTTNKAKKDKLTNFAVSGNFSGEGATASSNVIYNIYENNVTSKIENTAITGTEKISGAKNLTVEAFSDREFENSNVGLSVTGIGANLLANALVNEIGTDTLAYIDAQSQNMFASGKLTVKADDNTFANNKIGFGGGVGLGAALGANINLYYSDNLARAEILSNSDGHIQAGSAEIKANTTGGLDNTNVGVAAGLVGIAGDVVSIKLGKHSDYTDSEKKSGIEDADKKVENIYKTNTGTDKKFRETNSEKLETGAISRVNGNLETKNDITVKAESKLKGKNADDKLTLRNVDVTAGLGTGSVAVRNIQLSNNTVAEIAGGTVESKSGNISVNAINNSNVDITTTKVDVSGLTFSGGSSIYNNNSETIAQIGSSSDQITTAINAASGIDVVSASTNKSVIDATNVVVTGGNIVAVDLSENKDNNNTLAQIIGKTDIDTKGKLTIHSTANTDLSSTKSTVSVAGVSMVSVSKNEVNASTISKAIIKDVEGTITANGIDIITDYDVMSAFSKANVTAVKLGDLYSGDSSGATMNAKFTSGIDSETALSINNSGKTKIETAKKTGKNGIEAKSEINNVHVSLQGFVAETSAKAENTAESNTYLIAASHKADLLDINSYLDSNAEATAGATKVAVGIGVNVVSADAKDSSTLNVNVNGNNKIKSIANINASHNSKVYSDISAFNFGGLVGGGQRIRIVSELTSDTIGNIGGDFNSANTNIIFNTVRNSTMSKGSKSGSGVINVNDFASSNELTGTSTLNINNFKSNNNSINKLTINNISNNTFDITSSDSSGGFINVSSNSPTKQLDTSTITNIIDSNINSRGSISYSVQNNSIVKDSASMASGGFVNIMSNSTENTYTSNAELSLNNSTVSAHDINIGTLSDISSAKDDYIEYSASGGGFVAGQKLYVKNTLNQTSKINLVNSKVLSEQDMNLSVKTTSKYKQKIENQSGGFVALPMSESKLEANNTQELNLNSNSQVKSQGTTTINLDSSNTLASRVSSIAKDFAGAPEANSYVTATINNTINNSGQIGAGNLVDINFMNSSVNNLTVYAYTQNDAAVAKTYEDGLLKRVINNTLNLPDSSSQILSNQDVEISYSNGSGINQSTVAWDTTSYLVFGIPIPNSGESNPKDIQTKNALNLDGEIIAGAANSKYMRINQDGSIDVSATKGFSVNDYELITGGSDGQVIKDEKLTGIQIKIDNTERTLGEYQAEYDALSDAINNINQERNDIANSYDYIYRMCTEKQNGTLFFTILNIIPNEEGNSDFSNKVINDFKSLVIGNGSDKISESTYNTIFNAYKAKVQEQSEINTNKISTFMEFFKDYNTDLTSIQKTTIKDACNRITDNLSVQSPMKVSVYKGIDGKFYGGLKNPYINDSGNYVTDERTYALNKLNDLKAEIDSLDASRVEISPKITELKQLRDDLKAQYNALNKTLAEDFINPNDRYSIVFKNVNLKEAHISVDGITNAQITGSGKFDVGSSLFQIDNYSTRSLIFNDIDLTGAAAKSSLSIDGKNYSIFANSDKAVNGTNAYNYMYNNGSFNNIGTAGVHYISNSETGNSGIIVNNFYDNTHPFAKILEIPNSTLASDIIFNSLIKSNADFKIFNDSGSIITKSLETDIIGGTINLVATKGNVDLTSNRLLQLDSSDSIFAGNSVKINANVFNKSAETPITAGYNSDLNIDIGKYKSADRTTDPVTGKYILLNYGETPWLNDTNNIKALYVPDEFTLYIYGINKPLYNDVLNSDRGKIDISYNSTNTPNTITDNIKLYDGYQNISIKNNSFYAYTLDVGDIYNTKSEGGLYINGVLQQLSDDNYKNVPTANTQIEQNADSKLVLNGLIRNQLYGDYLPDTDTIGVLTTSSKGLTINKQTDKDGNVIDSILSSGIVDISSPDRVVDILGNITNTNAQDNPEFSIRILNNSSYDFSTGEYLTISGAITSALNGDIIIENARQMNITSDSVISTNNGNISITTSIEKLISHGVDLNSTIGGKIKASNGDIKIDARDNLAFGENSLINTDKGNISINSLNNTSIAGTISSHLGNTDIEAGNALSTGVDSLIGSYNGDVSIKNSGVMNLSGTIEAENGSLSVYSNSDSRIGGKVSVENGDIYIENQQDSMSITAEINHNVNNNNANGMISIINDTFASLNLAADIKSYGAGKYVTENDSEILKAIEIINYNEYQSANNNNFTISNAISARVGDIYITDYSPNFKTTAKISNTENGSIYIKNIKGNADIGGQISVNKGDINIENSTGNLSTNGILQNADGNIIITNNGRGINLGGYISDENGDLIITNTKGNMTVSSTIDHNVVNTDSNGMITITNAANAGKLDIKSAIKTEGSGKIVTDGTDEILRAILIDNKSATNGLEINNGTISARLGDIVIENAAKDLNIESGSITNTEKGNVIITNSGDKLSSTTAINVKLGDVIITNAGSGQAVVGGSITDQEGNIAITNYGDNLNITSSIFHNLNNPDASGLISITNKPDAGQMTIESQQITTGGMGNENGKAIIINNQSNTDGTIIYAADMSARTGDIEIINTTDNISVAGAISNVVSGDISITNTGKILQSTATITNNSGNTTITNNGTERTLIGSSITNRNGNVTISSIGNTFLELTNTIDNSGGNVTITNENDQMRILNSISNKGGDITITNNGEFTEIKSSITNEVMSDSEQEISGSITISNAKGHLIIDGSANSEMEKPTISNKSNDANKGITIINADTAGNMEIGTEIISTNKGNINIINNSCEKTTIQDNITAYIGNINITNDNNVNTTIQSDTIINGKITTSVGDVSIINNNRGNVNVSAITVSDGDISIETNNSKNTSIYGNIENKVKGDITIAQENSGMINIIADIYETDGEVNILSIDSGYSDRYIVSDGDLWRYIGIQINPKGSIISQKGNILLDNIDTDGNNVSAIYQYGQLIALDGSVTVCNTNGLIYSLSDIIAEGDVTVMNNAGDLIMDALYGTTNGDINIGNYSGNLYISNNAMIVNLSNPEEGEHGITIINYNNDDVLGMYIDGYILNMGGGDIDIINEGHEGAIISGIVENYKGDINITNYTNELDLLGEINAKDGNIKISNSGQYGTILRDSNIIKTENGKITIGNAYGNLMMEEGAKIVADNEANLNDYDVSITNYSGGAMLSISGEIENTGINGISIVNNSISGMDICDNAKITNATTDTIISNTAGNLKIYDGAQIINTQNGNISIENINNSGSFTIAGLLDNQGVGKIIVNNQGAEKLDIQTTGTLTTADGNIEISNISTEGIDIQGIIRAENQKIVLNNKDSDIRIGEFDSNNNHYVNAVTGDVEITQINGNILNNIVDPDAANQHQNYNHGTDEQSYKTLIATGGNLTIDVKDGSIGSTTNTNPGFSIEGKTRDYTESINVNVGGSIVAKAINENLTDAQLVNLRATESDMNIKEVISSGNVILTAADWKQADTIPTPVDDNYFKGYSILSDSEGNNPTVTGQMISMIASDSIGTANKKLIYNQDTASNPNSSMSIEAENDINITGRANSMNPTKIYQIISKHGSIDSDLESDAIINEITSGKGLVLTQKAQNLTILELGKSSSEDIGGGTVFEDMLYPHDNIAYGNNHLNSDSGSIIPSYINIKVLDAIDTPNRSNSTLNIYSAYVKGNQGEYTQYYPDGTRLADVTIMADNIYANSDKAPDSNISTKENPNGYMQTGKTYSPADFGGDDTNTYSAKGINAYGNGEAISIDILGVDKDIVDNLVPGANRNAYSEQRSLDNIPSKFKNDLDRVPFYGYDYRADNVVISVNDYADTNRGVVFDTIYANNAYINTSDSKLSVQDGYINNYAELRNSDKLAIIDNDYRRLLPAANIQLYTQKTGSFDLDLNQKTINMKTTAPTVYNNPHMLVNGYHSEWNFVNLGQKESKDLFENKKMTENLNKSNYNEPQKYFNEIFDTTNDKGLSSNYEILDISPIGVSVRNDKNLKIGKKTTLTIKFDDIDITVNAKVVKVEGNKAGLEFIDMPKDVANKILYRYMQRPNSIKSNLSVSLQ